MSSNEEQSFSIQPHPATTNDPNTDPALNKGQAHSEGADPKGKPGVHIPSGDVLDKLEEPKSKEELQAASAKLNQ